MCVTFTGQHLCAFHVDNPEPNQARDGTIVALAMSKLCRSEIGLTNLTITPLIHSLTYRIRRTAFCRSTIALVFFVLLNSSASLAQKARPQRVPATRPARLNVQFHRAETAWKSGNSLLEAKARIDRVLNELPRDAEARKLRAGIFISMGNAENAVHDARMATRISPFDGEAHLLLCEACTRAGIYEEALRALNRSADLLLDQSTYHVRLSRCAVSLGHLDAAEAYARTAVAGNTRDAAAYLQLARVFVLKKNPGKAVTVLERGMRSRVLRLSAIRRDSLLSPISDRLE